MQLEPPAVTKTPEPTVFTDGTVEVENVIFNFDRDFIEKVGVSELPTEKLEAEDIKPNNIRGRTLEFALKYRGSEDKALIKVFKIADYKEAFARFPQYLEQRDRELASLIDKPATVKRWVSKSRYICAGWMRIMNFTRKHRSSTSTVVAVY